MLRVSLQPQIASVPGSTKRSISVPGRACRYLSATVCGAEAEAGVGVVAEVEAEGEVEAEPVFEAGAVAVAGVGVDAGVGSGTCTTLILYFGSALR